MRLSLVRHGLLAGAILGASTLVVSCGTLLHPERRGQKTTKQLDTSIVVLDAIGLLFFIVPGVIAFAVDFNNGTIYLPEDQTSRVDPHHLDRAIAIHVPPGKLTRERIAAIVSEHLGRRVELSANDVKVREVDPQ